MVLHGNTYRMLRVSDKFGEQVSLVSWMYLVDYKDHILRLVMIPLFFTKF